MIEDNVEIGANSCIDRGALGETRIGEGTKIDNLVQIAHNVQIGKNCIIGANAFLPEGKVIPDNSMVLGSPAKVTRDLTAEEVANLARIADGYAQPMPMLRLLGKSVSHDDARTLIGLLLPCVADEASD